MQERIDWLEEFPGGVTLCDREGTVLFMNRRAGEIFSREGGCSLVGKNLLECHPEPARTKLKGMLESGKGNAYTIEKGGVKKLIYQSPWYREGVYSGFVELSLEIPEAMANFVRKG